MRSVWFAMAMLLASPFSAGAEPIVTCTDTSHDPAAQLAQQVDQLDQITTRFADEARTLDGHGYSDPAFAGQGSDADPSATVWDKKAVMEGRTGDQAGKAPTVAWNDDEKRQFQAAEGKLPPCVRAKAGVQEAYRIQRNVSLAKTGVPVAVYGFNNDDPRNPHGLIAVANAFFDHTLYGGKLGADQQIQAGLAYLDCRPPDHGLSADNVVATLDSEPEFRGITRDRVLFHEYIHGVTHMQMGEGRTNPLSREGFFGPNGASRWQSLHDRLYGDTPEAKELADLDGKYRSIPNDLAHRAESCAAWKARADFLTAHGVPSRWPNDTHAIDDKEEYITILVEQAIYDPNGVFGAGSPYSKAEQTWVKGWWQNTFGAPLGQCGAAVASTGSPDRSSAQGFSALQNWQGGF
jgi:hypothetical protein